MTPTTPVTLKRVAIFVLTLSLVTSSSAFADDADDARAAMRRGSAALERGDNEAALVEYEVAKKLVPSANAPYFFAAEALTRLGRWREAVENLEEYLAKDPTVSDAETVKTRIAKVKADHFPGRVRLVIRPEGATGGVSILIDGRPATSPNANGQYELPPGLHRLEISTPDRKPASQDIQVVGDTDNEIPIDLGPPLPPITNNPPPITIEPPTTNPWPTVGLITAGVGAGGLLTTVILDATVLGSKVDDYNRAADQHDPTRASSALSDYDSTRTGVIVGYVASSVVLVGGGLLWFLTRSEKKLAATRNGIRFVF